MTTIPEATSTYKLLGYFTIFGLPDDCIIIDGLHARHYTDDVVADPFDSGVENQIVVKENYVKTAQSTYSRVGAYIDIEGGSAEEIEYDIDIPVYLVTEEEQSLGICIKVESFITALKVTEIHMDEDDQPLPELVQYNETFEADSFNTLNTTKNLECKFLGYTTVFGGYILISEADMIRLCTDYIDYDAQIIAPPEGDEPGFRVGISIEIERENTGRKEIPEDILTEEKEIPIYGFYQGNSLKIIWLDYTSAQPSPSL